MPAERPDPTADARFRRRWRPVVDDAPPTRRQPTRSAPSSRPVDAECLAELGRAAAQIAWTASGRTTTLAHHGQTAQRGAGTQQDGRGLPRGTADRVGAPVHPVGEVHVEVTGGAEHGPGAQGLAPVPVAACVLGPAVGLHLHDPDRRTPLPPAPCPTAPAPRPGCPSRRTTGAAGERRGRLAPAGPQTAGDLSRCPAANCGPERPRAGGPTAQGPRHRRWCAARRQRPGASSGTASSPSSGWAATRSARVSPWPATRGRAHRPPRGRRGRAYRRRPGARPGRWRTSGGRRPPPASVRGPSSAWPPVRSWPRGRASPGRARRTAAPCPPGGRGCRPAGGPSGWPGGP